jgi:membrane-associated protease RseP (regulator of RpoE activity)
LLPIGQLDGGHIVYAFIGQKHKPLSRVLVAALVPLGIVYSHSWLVWAVLLFFFGLRHPVIYDITRLDRTRVHLGLAALAMFLLTFMLVPLK